jgi:predicted nucleotidyltransferase
MSADLSPDAALDEALAHFAAAVEAHYGARLHGIWLFGSRARGDHRVDSDVDIAVVLEEPANILAELRQMGDISFPLEVETGAFFQMIPILRKTWEKNSEPLIKAIHRDAKPIGRNRARVEA